MMKKKRKLHQFQMIRPIICFAQVDVFGLKANKRRLVWEHRHPGRRFVAAAAWLRAVASRS